MTSINEGGTTTANVFSGGEKQKVENLHNKVDELISRLDIVENKIEGLRIDVINLKAKAEAEKEEVEINEAEVPDEDESKAEPEIKKDFAGVKGAEENDEPVEKTAKSDKKKSKK